MTLVIHLAWIFIIACRYAGIIAVYAGVALFGFYFIGGNARSKNNAVPTSSWLGKGPRLGMKIAGVGAAVDPGRLGHPAIPARRQLTRGRRLAKACG